MNLSSEERKVIKWLRISYWYGAILDAMAFLQMAFPKQSAKLMGITPQPGADYVFAMRLGAALELAWTVLLIWADRKPLERAGILSITLIILVIDIPTMIGAVVDGLVPLGTMIPQIILVSLLFVLYVYSYWRAIGLKRNLKK